MCKIRGLTWGRFRWMIFLLALTARIAFVLTQQNGFYFPDSLGYFDAGLELLRTGDFGANYGRAPAYSVFLAGVYLCFGESVLAIRISESVLGAAIALLLAVLGKRIAGKMVGVLAGTIWAIYPLGIFICGLVYPTNITAFLLACAACCILPVQNEQLSAKRVFAGGAFLGLAALAIPVALLTIVFVAGWVLYWGHKAAIRSTAFLALGAIVFLAPWMARNYLVHQEFLPVEPGVLRHLPTVGNLERNGPETRIEAILRRPDLYAARFGRNFVQFWELYPTRLRTNNQEYRNRVNLQDPRVVKETIYNSNRFINAVSLFSTGPVLFFALLGTAGMWLRKDCRRPLALLWVMTLSFAVGYAFFVGKIRYRIPVEPYLIILGSYGLYDVYVSVRARLKSIAVPSHSVTSP